MNALPSSPICQILPRIDFGTYFPRSWSPARPRGGPVTRLWADLRLNHSLGDLTPRTQGPDPGTAGGWLDGGQRFQSAASTFSPCPGSVRPWCTRYCVRHATTPSRQKKRSHLN